MCLSECDKTRQFYQNYQNDRNQSEMLENIADFFGLLESLNRFFPFSEVLLCMPVEEIIPPTDKIQILNAQKNRRINRIQKVLIHEKHKETFTLSDLITDHNLIF